MLAIAITQAGGCLFGSNIKIMFCLAFDCLFKRCHFYLIYFYQLWDVYGPHQLLAFPNILPEFCLVISLPKRMLLTEKLSCNYFLQPTQAWRSHQKGVIFSPNLGHTIQPSLGSQQSVTVAPWEGLGILTPQSSPKCPNAVSQCARPTCQRMVHCQKCN